MTQPTTVAEHDTAVDTAAGMLRDRLLLDIALVHRDDLAIERARYDLMCAAFDRAVRVLAEERLGWEKDAAEYRAALVALDTENRRLKARAKLAPLGQQVRQAIRTGQPIGIAIPPYSEADDEIGASKRHGDV